MKTIDIWMEGFAATGQHQKASKIGTYKAQDFDGAVKQYMKQHPDRVQWDRYGPGKHAIWACRLFDNEKQARKAFG